MRVSLVNIVRLAAELEGNKVQAFLERIVKAIREFTGLQDFRIYRDRGGQSLTVISEVPKDFELETDEDLRLAQQRDAFGLRGVQIRVGDVKNITGFNLEEPDIEGKVGAFITFTYQHGGEAWRGQEAYRANPEEIRNNWRQNFLQSPQLKSALQSGGGWKSEHDFDRMESTREFGEGTPGAGRPSGAGQTIELSVLFILEAPAEKDQIQRIRKIIEGATQRRELKERELGYKGFSGVQEELRREYRDLQERGELPPGISFADFRRQELEKRREQLKEGKRERLWASEHFAGMDIYDLFQRLRK